MKSPWEFLSQLIPQRRSTIPRAISPEDVQDTEKSDVEAQQSSGSALVATEGFQGSERDPGRPTERPTTPLANKGEPGIDAEPEAPEHGVIKQLHAPAHRQPIRPAARSRPHQAESEPSKKPSRKRSSKKHERRKSIPTGTVAESAAVAHRKMSAPAPSTPDAFLTEMSILDEDIKQLRIQLAHKLHLQNVQLKKMLARFDGS